MKSFETYLSELLGDEEKVKLRHALDQNKVIIISGAQQSGKTTLARTLRKFGYNAVEDFDTYEIKLTKPLEYKIRNFKPGLRQSCCPYCGASNTELFYSNNDRTCIGCSGCMYKSDKKLSVYRKEGE